MGIYNSKQYIDDEQKKIKQKRLNEIGYEKFQRKNSMLMKLPKHYAINQCKTLDPDQVFKSNRPNTHTFDNVGVPRYSNKGISKEEDKTEYVDSLPVLQEKVRLFLDLLRNSKNAVVYTGAGISTSASLPDFRGPHGAWTKEESDYKPGNHKEQEIPSLKDIVPTLAHMAIGQLVEMGLIKAVITTNMDNLHRRAGVPDDKLWELHGCSFKERCTVCGKNYIRDDEIYTTETLRCEEPGCTGTLVDTIVNFNEPINDVDWKSAVEISKQCDLAIVLGTSMRVLPSCLLPEMGLSVGGLPHKMVICNFQITPYDDASSPRFFCPTDDLFYYLMQELGISAKVVTDKGEQIKIQTFPTPPKDYHVSSEKLDPKVYDINFRFLF